MALRVSAELTGQEVDLSAVTDAAASASSGVARAEELIGFTDALVRGSDAELSRARTRLLSAIGAEGLVDTAAVVGNFQRMVRIADSTGIPLDRALDVLSKDVRDELRLERFGSARNTRSASPLLRAAGRVVRPLLHGWLRTLGRNQRG